MEFDADASSPEVNPIYLRDVPTKMERPTDAENPPETVVDVDEAAVDGISRSIMELFERSIRASVVAAVRALAPHMVIRFSETSDSTAKSTQSDNVAPWTDALEDDAAEEFKYRIPGN